MAPGGSEMRRVRATPAAQGLAAGLTAILLSACTTAAAATGGGLADAERRAYEVPCRPSAFQDGTVSLYLLGDDSGSAVSVNAATTATAAALLRSARRGDRVIGQWLNSGEWFNAAPQPTEDEDGPVPASPRRPALLEMDANSDVKIAGSDESESRRRERNRERARYVEQLDAYTMAAVQRCGQESRFDGRFATWKAAAAEAVRGQPPTAPRSPVVEALARARDSLSLLPPPRIIVISGDVEPFGGRAEIPPHLLSGVHVVVAPFMPDGRDPVVARDSLAAFLAQGDPASVTVVPAAVGPGVAVNAVDTLRPRKD